ncbi:MAG: alpha/beta fold hydrolase [Pseudomonadota bacterium]
MALRRTIFAVTSLFALLLVAVAPAVVSAENADQAAKGSWSPGSYEPYPFPYYVDDVERYPATTPPDGTVNRHGELEYLGNGVFGTHWFVEAQAATWHFVTAGDQTNDVVLLIHGHPDTWYAFRNVMIDLAEDHYVIAVDTLGYGQSDKRPDIDVSYGAVARSLTTLLDNINVDQFNLITHDRGSVISDHLIAIDGMSTRIKAFLRMQQSFDQPHGLPRPNHEAMMTVEFHQAENFIRNLYAGNYVSVKVPEEELKRLEWEWGFTGTPEASARTFQGTSFDIEREFRMANTIPKMTMPVVIMQGSRDPAQKLEEYYRSANLLPNGRVVIVDVNHFIHTEAPETVARVARNLFKFKNANRPDLLSFESASFIYPEK